MLQCIVENEQFILLPIMCLIAHSDEHILVVDVVNVVQNPQRHAQRAKVFTGRLLLVENGHTNGAYVLERLMVLGHIHRRR